jgi:hypothetical protein
MLGAKARIENPEFFDEFDQKFAAALAQYNERFSNYTTYPINEVVAWTFIYDGMCSAWYEYLDVKCDANAVVETEKHIEFTKQRFRSQKDGLVLSLRYHNYSARAFAMLVEALFRMRGI